MPHVASETAWYEDDDPRDRKHISKTLALAEGSAGVANKPQREQSTEQADGGKRLELSYRDDLGDEISC